MIFRKIYRVLGIGAAAVSLLALLVLLAPLPNPVFSPEYSTAVYSADGTLLQVRIAEDEQWRFRTESELSPKYVASVTLYEDEYFNFHPGVNPISVFRAALQNIKAGSIVSGGSTLDMQTVRLATGESQRDFFTKMVEVWCALKLNLLYSKREILNLYARNAPFGRNLVGIGAASHMYFGRNSENLSWAESALLAVLPNNPGDVYPGRQNELLKAKRDFLLEKLHDRGFLSYEDLELSKSERIPEGILPLPRESPHLLTTLEKEQKGRSLNTTINSSLQAKVTSIVNRYSRQLDGNEIHNAAALVLDIRNNRVLAYVGNSMNSLNHGNEVDVIMSKRSPGSLLKPILYASALDAGLIYPQQLLPDVPLFYRGFAPKNFDKQYRGAVPADNALVSSLNVPFVHLLINYGYERFHKKLKDMGMHSLDKPASHYGLSLILGGAETSLWEVTNIYAGMARALLNFDSRPYQKGFSKVDYLQAAILSDYPTERTESEKFGYLNPHSISSAFSAMKALERPDESNGWRNFSSTKTISWKTGTSYGHRDGWSIGFDSDYIVGVWVGNADGEGRPGLTGVGAAAPLMFKIFNMLDGEYTYPDTFGAPEAVCAKSGMLAGKHCSETRLAHLSPYMYQAGSCTYHRVLNLDATESWQVNSSCYNIAEMRQISWFVLPPNQAIYYRKFNPAYRSVPDFDPSCSSENDIEGFDVIYPNELTRIKIPVEQDGMQGRVVFEAAHSHRQAIVHWHLDDSYIGLTEGTHKKGITASVGEHILTLVDQNGNEVKRIFIVVPDGEKSVGP